MKTPRRHRGILIALWANAALLLVIATALVTRSSFTPSAFGGLAPQPIAGGGNLYIMPAQLLTNVWGCYVLDVDNQTLCVYEYNGNQVKLIGARGIKYDHQLEMYNTSPDPEKIRTMIEQKKGRILKPVDAEHPVDSQPAPDNK